ncbi:hypothetical protein [Thiothrix subterranea]|uniref:Uncharacterized protein n=1 Tax=Thiothrix subterranea TaxID=2735563 RepID=A0AA51MN96_9GAMM|nr:hypothetical protein [Thiothrix subterranea]MDQ5770473.1 hypothetical protein [Thiothrix subterranea]WML86849.1 hypothetical protein RCG00_21525 [Thiothrix subterranea]
MYIPLADHAEFTVKQLMWRWHTMFREKGFADVSAASVFIEQALNSAGTTRLEVIEKQVARRQSTFGGIDTRYNVRGEQGSREPSQYDTVLVVMGREVNRFERDNFLSQTITTQEQPACDSLDNPGGDHHDNENKKIYRQLRALCETLIKMGYGKNESGSIEVIVGDGALFAIQKQCYADHGIDLFSPPKEGKNKRDDTFYGIWKTAKSEEYGRLVISIPRNNRGG